MDKNVFDQYAKNYRETHEQYLPAGVRREQFFIQKTEWVSSYFRPNTAYLDFGCNQGELCIEMATRFPEAKIVGVDEAVQSLEQARKYASRLPKPIPFYSDLKFEGTFDLVSTFNVLHHVLPEDRKKVIHEIKGKLNPRARFLIWEHNPWNPLTRYLVKICPFDKGVKLVSSRWLLKTLQEEGFTVEKFEYVNLTPPVLHRNKFFAIWERIFKKIPIGTQYRMVVRNG